MNMQNLIQSIKNHEGKRNTAYQDPLGIWTIGYGHNLEARPLSDAVIEHILAEDIETALRDVRSIVPAFDDLDDTRREVLVEMVFNLGKTRFSGFKRMLAAMYKKDFDIAADEMLNSVWHRQVGKRAEVLAQRMRLGKDV